MRFGAKDSWMGRSLPRRQNIRPSRVAASGYSMYLTSNRSRGCWRERAAAILPPYRRVIGTILASQYKPNSSWAFLQSGTTWTGPPMMPRLVWLTSTLTCFPWYSQRSLHVLSLGTMCMPRKAYFALSAMLIRWQLMCSKLSSLPSRGM